MMQIFRVPCTCPVSRTRHIHMDVKYIYIYIHVKEYKLNGGKVTCNMQLGFSISSARFHAWNGIQSVTHIFLRCSRSYERIYRRGIFVISRRRFVQTSPMSISKEFLRCRTRNERGLEKKRMNQYVK